VRETVEVSGAQTLSDVDVLLNITHPFDTDLDVFLESPGGTVVELFTDIGGDGDDFTDTLLDDEAPEPLLDSPAAAPFTGRFRPEGSLADFDGEDPNGTWTLHVTDDQGTTGGNLDGWSLILHGTTPCD
jgi:subtilisin-like proprotein convertase family protein